MAGTHVAVKAAAVAVKNRDNLGKIIIVILMAIIIPFLLIVICFMDLISAFFPDGSVSSTDTYDVTQTAIYSSVSPVTESFFTSVKEDIEAEKEKIVEENTVIETSTDENGNTITTKKCNLTIKKTMNYVGSGYLIAYLMYTDGLDIKTAKIDQDKANEFLNDICTITTKKVSDSEYEIENTYLSLDEIAEKYFETETEQKKFKASCAAYADFFKTNEAEVTTEIVNIYDVSGMSVNLLEVPLYLQYLGAWAQTPYGNGTIAQKGCAPTCLAMVLSYLKQEVILPSDVVAWTGNRYYVSGAGSSWDIFPAVANQWGVTCTNLGKNQQAMIQALSEGKPVIASMAPGTFTKGGHFIVLTGITENGNIKVNDPNDNSTTKNFKDKEFDPALIFRESKNFWSFE